VQLDECKTRQNSPGFLCYHKIFSIVYNAFILQLTFYDDRSQTMNPGDLTPTRVTIVFNPEAGQSSTVRSAIEQATILWQAQGWIVNIEPTQCAGDGTRIAREAAANGINIVVAAGGDGTVNEVMNGLVNTNTALGTLPAGTVNIWAREMGLPMDILQSAAALLEAKWCQIDVGRVTSIVPRRWLLRRRITTKSGALIDRHFLLMAGIGFDAAVTAGVSSAEKKSWGAIAYVKQAFQIIHQYQGSHLTIYWDDKKVRGRVLMAVVGNSQLYGGVIKFTLNAVVDDGLLDVCIVKGRSMLKAPLRLLSILFRSHHLDDRIEYHRATQIRLVSRKPVPIQIDGDYLGTTPMRLAVVPKSLWVLVPPNADRTLWQEQNS
jgi:diacylglycerol kinase (ATP)